MKNKFLTCLFIIILHTSVAAQGEVELSAEQKIKKAKEYYLIGKQLIQQGNYSAADEEFKKAQQLLKESSSTVTSKTQPVLVTTPSQPQVSPPPQPALQSPVAKAWELAKKGEALEEAILQYLKAISLEPQNPDLHYNLAVEYLKTNQFMKASEAFKRVIQLNPKDKDAYYNLGVLHESYLGDKKQAIAYYTKYIKLTSRKEYTSQVKAWIRQIKAESKRK